MLFRVGLLLVRLALGSSEKLRDCAGLVETLEKLRNIPVHLLQEDIFMAEVETDSIPLWNVAPQSSLGCLGWKQNQQQMARQCACA